MVDDLTVLVVTKLETSILDVLTTTVHDVRKLLGARMVIAVDGNADLRDDATLDGDVKVVRVSSRGYIESVLDTALRYVDTPYVLRLDDDETMSDAMIGWLRDLAYRLSPNWKFPRIHLWEADHTCVVNPPLWPDHQTRLSRRELAGGRAHIHQGSPHGGGDLAPCAIIHHKFVCRPYDERRAIVDRYERLQSGAGAHFRAFSVPEDVIDVMDLASTARFEARAYRDALPDVAALAVNRAFEIGMHQHRAEISEFAQWLATSRPLHHVIEIGALKGGTASLWHALSTGRVISVDMPGGRFGGADHGYDEAACRQRNEALLADHPRFRGVIGSSHDATTFHEVKRLLGRERADLLFIDGDHTLEGVRADYYMYRDLVVPGGIIAFHDVNNTQFHVNAGCMVHEFWRTLTTPKAVMSINADWGGIGVTFAPG